MSLYCPHMGHRVTIRGHCSECAPELHDEHARLDNYYKNIENLYFQETGKRSLESWHEFEKFLDMQIKKGILPEGSFPLIATNLLHSRQNESLDEITEAL